MSASIKPGHSVAARLTYTIDTGVKPITGTTDSHGRLRHRTGEFEEREMTIHDGRPDRAAYYLEREGFTLVDHPTQVEDFYDPEELLRVYYAEIECLVKKLSGA